jgi:ornithine decarboxylase
MNINRVVGILATMGTLAAIDLVGALFAKEYAERHRPLALVLGVASFIVLFGVYVVALRYAELSIVTMGWIAMLQIGLLVVDRRLYGLHLDLSQWAAVVVIIVLQCYLIVSSASPASPAPSAEPAVEPVPFRTTSLDAPTPTPSLMVDLGVVAERYRQLTAALPGVVTHYAVKANPEPEVLRLLVRAGSSFDVASPTEIDACLAAGAPAGTLSYGNTAKKERDIAAAHKRGVRIFTFDDATELAKLQRSAPGATLLCRLATSGEGADWALSTKFGCTPPVARRLLTEAARAGHPVGLAFHVGSQQRDPGQWEVALRSVGRLQSELAADGIRLAMIDIGGGFPASYREPAPPIDAYGSAITASIARHIQPTPKIICEPGRFLVADAGVLESEVVLVAERAGRRWVHLDIGRYGGLAETLDEAIQYRIETDRDGGPQGPVALAGPTCDSTDVLYTRADYWLPLALVAGDRVRLHSTGAYTASYASVGFNGIAPLATHFRPAGLGSPGAAAGRPRSDLVHTG